MEKEKKTAVTQIKIEPSLKEKAQAKAKENGRSLSNYICYLITKDVSENK